MNSRQRGFTLIELAVVAAVIGVLATAVSLTLRPDSHAAAKHEIERLRTLLELAAGEARWSGASMGWSASGSGYRFFRLDDNGTWREIDDDERFAPRRLPEGVQITAVELEGQMLGPDQPIPFSVGATPIYRISLRAADRLLQLEGTPDGGVDYQAEPAS